MRVFVFICVLVLQGNAASLNADRDLEMPPLPEEERDLEMPPMPAEDDRAYDDEMPPMPAEEDRAYDDEMPPMPAEDDRAYDDEMPPLSAEDDRAYDDEMPMPEEVRAEMENEETMQVRGRININIETGEKN